MPAFERHVFVCINERAVNHPRGSCHAKESDAIAAAFKAALKQRGLNSRVRANKAQCLDQCEHGPTVVVYPEQVWYGFVEIEDVEDIVESHLVEGRPVERLRLPETCINTLTCPHRGLDLKDTPQPQDRLRQEKA